MKRKYYLKKIICLLIIFEAVISLSGCYRMKEKKYYSDESNYITEEAVVISMNLYEEKNSIYLGLTQIDEAYQDNAFKIEGENAKLLIERGIFEKIESGDKIMYTSAPGYFGDGYCMPIISISCDGEELLSFEEGHENLLNLY